MTTAAIPRLVAGLLAASVLLACGSGSAEEMLAPAEMTTQPPALTTYDDQEGRFSILYPAAWERSMQSLTPGLTDPREIVSVGSYHMRPGGELCAHLPVNALEDLSPADAFLTIQERAQPHLADYPPRPTQFDLGKPTEGFDGELCVREPGDLDQWWLPFRDGSRAFYALVALGTSASKETRQQVTQTLNSFHIDE
jgi:hypothetical protein